MVCIAGDSLILNGGDSKIPSRCLAGMLLCMTIMIINFIKYILFSFNVLILSRIHYILLRPKIGMVNSAFFFFKIKVPIVLHGMYNILE